MPVGTALAGPIAAAVGTQATLLGMSAIGVVCALGFLSVREVRDLPRVDAPVPDPQPVG
jgi:hypothetical protein